MNKIDKLKRALDTCDVNDIKTPVQHYRYGAALYDYANCFMEKAFKDCIEHFDGKQNIDSVVEDFVEIVRSDFEIAHSHIKMAFEAIPKESPEYEKNIHVYFHNSKPQGEAPLVVNGAQIKLRIKLTKKLNTPVIETDTYAALRENLEQKQWKLAESDLAFGCSPFWYTYLQIAFINCGDDDQELSFGDIVFEKYSKDINSSWWNVFTQNIPGVIEISDGLIDNPTYMIITVNDEELRIEFHPGWYLYFLNGDKIGSVGPHSEVKTLPYGQFRKLVKNSNCPQLTYLLLLPLLLIKGNGDKSVIQNEIAQYLALIQISHEDCDYFAGLIYQGLSDQG